MRVFMCRSCDMYKKINKNVVYYKSKTNKQKKLVKNLLYQQSLKEDLFLYYGLLPSVSVLYQLSGVLDCCVVGLCRGSTI